RGSKARGRRRHPRRKKKTENEMTFAGNLATSNHVRVVCCTAVTVRNLNLAFVLWLSTSKRLPQKRAKRTLDFGVLFESQNSSEVITHAWIKPSAPQFPSGQIEALWHFWHSRPGLSLHPHRKRHSLQPLRRILFQLAQHDLDRPLQLRV